jgi:hypothetical protein
MSDTCLNCGGLIMEQGKTYGYAGPVCYCLKNPAHQFQRPASKEKTDTPTSLDTAPEFRPSLTDDETGIRVPDCQFLSDEDKAKLLDAQKNGYGVFMPGQWAEKLINELAAEKSKLAIAAGALRKADKALLFYEKVENFGVTVWEDESQDGRCWYEPAKDHGLGEIYGTNDTGDFGITAMEARDELSEALARIAPEGGV